VPIAAEALLKLRSRGLDFSTDGIELCLLSRRDPSDQEDAWIAAHTDELIRELSVVRWDFETASPLDLTNVGADVYAADPATQVLLLAWCIGMGDVQVWHPGQPVPDALREAITNGAVLVSHGAFDRIVWEWKMVPMGWPIVPLERWSDTSARARAYRAPASLEKAAQRLELRHQKSGEGKALIRKATGAAQGKGSPLDLDEQRAFDGYAAQDVATLPELDRRLPELCDLERSVWLLNEQMNNRGLPIDLNTVRRLDAVLTEEDERLIARMQKLCGLNPSQNLKLLTKLQETAIDPPVDLKAETLQAWSREDMLAVRPATSSRRACSSLTRPATSSRR
jgi:DNA polymerase